MISPASRDRLQRLETERLILRLPEERDFETWAGWMGDVETMRYLGTGAVMSREDAWRSMASVVGHWHLRGYGFWVMEARATGAIVGRGGLWYPEGWPGVEVGWLVDPRARGQGFATEMAKVAVDAAFNVLGLTEVISLILPQNVKSIDVAERLGCVFSRETTIRGLAVSQYAVTRRTWRR